MIAGFGYWSTGSKVPNIILDRDPIEGSKDYIFSAVKAGMLIALTFGVVIRLQLDRSGIWSIYVDVSKLLRAKNDSQGSNNVPLVPKKIKVPQNDENDFVPADWHDSQDGDNQKEINQSPEMSMNQRVFISLGLTIVVSFTALVVSSNFLAFIESGAGLFAPVFLIIFPCLITLKLHNDDILKLQTWAYYATWIYLVFASIFSYTALIINFFQL